MQTNHEMQSTGCILLRHLKFCNLVLVITQCSTGKSDLYSLFFFVLRKCIFSLKKTPKPKKLVFFNFSPSGRAVEFVRKVFMMGMALN